MLGSISGLIRSLSKRLKKTGEEQNPRSLTINRIDLGHETILTSSVNSERSARDRLKTASFPPTRMDPASESSTWKKSGDELRDVGVENRKAKPAGEGEEKHCKYTRNVADGCKA